MLDVLIRGGRVVDGTGNPWYRADVGVQGGQIVAIGRLATAEAAQIINAEGLIVAPGFIDVHCHTEMALLREPRHEARVRQGITTELLGQDGVGYAPVSLPNRPMWADYLLGVNGPLPVVWDWSSVAEFLAKYDRRVAINVAYLVPHGVVRYEVMGDAQRPPTADELRQMQQLVAQGLADGAVGLSTGLYYEPAIYANAAELVALCRPVAEAAGVFVAHMRDYGEKIKASLDECLTVGREAGVPVHISHYNTQAAVGLPLIDHARDEGIEITFDIYPYRAGCSILAPALGGWVQAGGVEKSLARLRHPEVRTRLRCALEDAQGRPLDKWFAYIIAGVTRPANRRFEGLNLPAAAEAARKSLTDFVIDLLLEERMAVTIIAHQTHRSEEDVEAAMRHPCQMFCSDAILIGGAPHPRGFGAYPRLLGHYVRERKALSLEECIRKMTSLPAQHIGLQNRGLLREGLAADIVCFDAQTVIDRATYEDGRRPPEGILYVLVNGQLVIDHGRHTGALPGRVLGR